MTTIPFEAENRLEPGRRGCPRTVERPLALIVPYRIYNGNYVNLPAGAKWDAAVARDGWHE